MKIRTALAGKKTYIIGALMFLIGVVNYLAGDMDLSMLLSDPNTEIMLEGLGLMALRAGIAK